MKSEPTREGHKTTFFGRDFGLSEVVREGGNFVVAVRRGRGGKGEGQGGFGASSSSIPF
ncbi:hypothetical protein DEO72_LG3g1123 [Vigna unguiculata]|uniref:Uncharacterized protein n=1 Tax=Vigna unguiculata TaxID=3917 RepID=A0A4D6LDC4_VIGUN|nr:hypothetical protein DEO72_LG3g1123 [Vigna unguiculata]